MRGIDDARRSGARLKRKKPARAGTGVIDVNAVRDKSGKIKCQCEGETRKPPPSPSRFPLLLSKRPLKYGTPVPPRVFASNRAIFVASCTIRLSIPGSLLPQVV